MILAAAGPIDGQITALYESLPPEVTWVLCPDFGIRVNKDKLDRATKRHAGVGEFNTYRHEKITVPVPTLITKSPHDEHSWLRQQENIHNELLPNLHYLINGFYTIIADEVKVVGLGGVFSSKHYTKSKPTSSKYYTKNEVYSACAAGKTDILMTYTGPTEQSFDGKLSNSAGINRVLEITKPLLYIHTGYGTSKHYKIGGTECFSLSHNEVKLFEITPQALKIIK